MRARSVRLSVWHLLGAAQDALFGTFGVVRYWTGRRFADWSVLRFARPVPQLHWPRPSRSLWCHNMFVGMFEPMYAVWSVLTVRHKTLVGTTQISFLCGIKEQQTPTTMKTLKLHTELTGENANNQPVHMVRLAENNIVIDAEVVVGNDPAGDFMKTRGLVEVEFDMLASSNTKSVFLVERAPSQEDIEG